MADSVARESGREATGSQTADAGDPRVARGATGAQPATNAEPQGDVEERRETEQVLRPTSDGMGDGLVKDQS